MEQETLIELLEKTKLITERAKALVQTKEEKGENFNIFEILNLSSYETWLHTPLLCELLDPHGSHGLKDAFLKSFIDVCQLDLTLDCHSATVTQELSLGNISNKGDEGGRIDIYIEDSSKNAIIIENKIYAEDQKNQLLRYNNYASAQNLKYQILYLTLDGTEPSEDSLGGRQIEYICISYRNTILTWLDQCITIAHDYPLVRETIIQYSNCIKLLLNIIDKENMDKLIEVTTSPEYIETTLGIFDHQEEIYTQIRKEFILSLQPIAERNGFTMDYDKGISSLVNNTFVSFKNPELSEHWLIFIGADNYKAKSHGVYFTISQTEEDSIRITKKFLGTMKGNAPLGQERTTYDPMGWDYLCGEAGTYWNWEDTDTLRDMANGKMAQYIEKEILQFIKNNGYLKEIERLTY